MKSFTFIGSLLLSLLLACNSSGNMNKNIPSEKGSILSDTAFDTQAHRGGRGIMPENTIPAMMNVLGLNVRTLEMDIVITKDKQVILSHEPFFNHEISTKPGGALVSEAEEHDLNIFQMSYEEAKNFDVGLKTHSRFPDQKKMAASKPLLADVFSSVATYMKTASRPYPYFNIETKCKPATDNIFHPAPGEMVELLMQVIRKNKMEKQVMIQSFDFRSLQYLHQHYPNVPTVMLIEDFDKISFEEQLIKLGFVADVYSPHYSLVTKELVEQCHAKKMKIVPWTVNTKKEMDYLKSLGVDGIISDFPDLF